MNKILKIQLFLSLFVSFCQCLENQEKESVEALTSKLEKITITGDKDNVKKDYQEILKKKFAVIWIFNYPDLNAYVKALLDTVNKKDKIPNVEIFLAIKKRLEDFNSFENLSASEKNQFMQALWDEIYLNFFTLE